jgi:hypothetical protein
MEEGQAAEEVAGQEPQPSEVAPPVVESSSPEPEPASEPEFVRATPEEAREKQYVPYDRFKERTDRLNEYKAREAQWERERELLLSRPAEQYAQAQPEKEEIDPYDPQQAYNYAAQTRSDLHKMRAETAAKDEAGRIEREIGKVVDELGFVDADRASMDIKRQIVLAVQAGQPVPDIFEAARSHRQSEINFEKKAIERWRMKKTSPGAAAAAPTPSSPPVVSDPPAKEGGWNAASSRLRDRLRGR